MLGEYRHKQQIHRAFNHAILQLLMEKLTHNSDAIALANTMVSKVLHTFCTTYYKQV